MHHFLGEANIFDDASAFDKGPLLGRDHILENKAEPVREYTGYDLIKKIAQANRAQI